MPESMAMYQAGRPTFRLSSKPEPEARMWVLEGMAGGIQPWWHMVSAYHEDRRMYKTVGPLLQFYKTNEEFLVNRQPIANVGLVWSQENTDYYGRDESGELIDTPWRGMAEAMIRANIPYLPVHIDHVEKDANRFSLLILPNLAAMSDKQVATIRRFVDRGGSLIASGESSLYNEWGERRMDFALADLFGAHATDKDNRKTNDGNHTYLRLTPELRIGVPGPHNGQEPAVKGKRHEILAGFDETDIFPFGGIIDPRPLDAGAEVLMTFIPEFPIYPPESAWRRVPKTDSPGLIVKSTPKGGRVAFMPADIDRQFARYNLPDHGNLLANMIRWALKDNVTLTVEGTGLVDCHLYRQQNRMVLHVVNLTNAGTWRAPIHELIPIGPIKIRVRLPDGVTGRKLKALVGPDRISSAVSSGYCEFGIRSILDHEIVVIS
jgi:hypothetical protein